MKHTILTRCKFDDDEIFNKYFEVIKKIYIPSINSQINKNFFISIVINSRHFDVIRKEIDNKIEILQFLDTKKDFHDYVVDNNIQIQTRHDCDDYMSPNYIEYIQKLASDNITKFDKCILNFHPTKLEFFTGIEYNHSRDYSKVCSMFSTLVQRQSTCGVMDVVHDHLYKITKNIIYIPPQNYVKLTIHSNNKLSKLHKEEKQLNHEFK